ncbi:MAG TPA: protein kinase [Planctomycetaceae bacterium]|nr:protein kinase [Planctomycetaceae bacterium]
MADLDLNDFEIGREIRASPERRVLEAIYQKTGDPVRMTVFSTAISLRPEFRRAVKMDRAMLSMLQHQSIIHFLGYGESSGSLFLCSTATNSTPLTEQLAAGRRFSSEDTVEIGWQICSALQQAHNLGLAHGGLSTDSVLLSGNLQVTVVDFGVARWLRAAAVAEQSIASGPALITIAALASREDVEQDLRNLSRVLVQILATCGDAEEADAGKVPTKTLMQKLLERFADSADPAHRPVSAREFQGRLGEILIGTGDDSMPLVDQRNAAATSRRSIVMELFEPDSSSPRTDRPGGRSATSAWRKRFLPTMVIIAMIIILLLLAGYFR